MRITRIKRNSVTKKLDLKNENSFEMERFLENFRAFKQSSSKQTKEREKKLFRSTKTRKSNIAMAGFFFEDRPWVL